MRKIIYSLVVMPSVSTLTLTSVACSTQDNIKKTDLNGMHPKK